MRYFHGEIESGKRAQELAIQLVEENKMLAGRVMVGYHCEQCLALLLVSLPDDVNPDELLPPGVEFKEGHATQVPAVEDQGIQE